MSQICGCGAQAGYPHYPECSGPNFNTMTTDPIPPCTCGVSEMPHYDAPKDKYGYLSHRKGCPRARFNFGPAVKDPHRGPVCGGR